MSQPQFSYEDITDSFVAGLVETVSRAESTVLIGPRYGGKRHVLFVLQKLLQEQGFGPLVAIQFLDQTPLQTEQEVRERIREAVLKVDPDLDLAADGHISDPIKQLWAKLKVPVILIASNVDGMALHLARRFLEGVRTLVDAQQAIAVLSGENDFHELVYGPKSEFNVASHCFVRGYGVTEFGSSISRYAQHLRFKIIDEDAFFRELWGLTGGNLYIARMILMVLVETYANSGRDPTQDLTVDDIPHSFKDSLLSIYGSHIFRHARQLVDREQRCWEDLKMLLAGEEIKLPAVATAPTHLELSGIAVRVKDENGFRLKFASPIMEEYTTLTYDNRRLGDLYARINCWPEAFEHYKKLDEEERIRPASSDDLNEVGATVNALSAALYSEATAGKDTPGALIDRIKELFEKGCHYILGFREISFWYRDFGQDAKWNAIPSKLMKFNDAELERLAALLPDDDTLPPGWLPLNTRFAVAAMLQTLSTEQQAAVIVGDLEKRPSISQERENLAKQLLDHFEKAYSHALRITQDRARNRVRGIHIDVINDILTAFRRSEVSVQYVLQMGARGLRQLGYRRVLFSLVDPEKKLLEGIVDDCDPPLRNVASLIRYDITDPTSSLQVHVLARKQELIVEDAKKHPMSDKYVVREGDMKAIAIVPILTPEDEVIGTLLVERQNVAPNEDEASDLLVFCKQLALALEHCQRTYLLQSGLNRMPDPILIVDSSERPRFANDPAARLLNIRAGWQNQTQTVTKLDRKHADTVIDVIHEVMSSGQRLASHLPGIGDNKNYRGAVVASVINESWSQGQREREKTVGGFLRIQDLTYLYKVFEASRHIAEAEDSETALRKMLDAAMQLGHEGERPSSVWGRLYLVRALENGDEEFVGHVSSGFTKKEFEEDFKNRKVVLAPRSEGHYEWLCVDQKMPVVFCWDDAHETGEICITPSGLKAINWKNPVQPVQIAKHAGDFWIDFPLLAREGRALGKICLQCDDDLQPENFVYLKVLCETFSRMLETFNYFEKTSVTVRKETAQKSLSVLAHNLATRLGSFSGYLARYRKYEQSQPDLRDINQKFKHALDNATAAIRRANEHLKPVILNRVQLDLSEHFEKALHAAALPRNGWSFKCESKPLYACVDMPLLEIALLELIQNSKDAAPEPEKIKIDIYIEVVGGGRVQPTARIRYRDNGPGIPAELGERVFQDFYSRRPGKRVGTGLGLGYVRRVVEAHGGLVLSNGFTHSGAEFIITLPL